MKIIQTFWSCSKKDLIKESFGWYSPLHHIQGWVLSSNLLRKHYSNVELYTDKLGYELLINKLNLPYSKVHVVLDALNNYNQNLWALPKIYTYSLQEEPFLHVDGDVFIWEKFSEELCSSDFITQNLESATNYYKTIWEKIESNLLFIPLEILEDRKNDELIKAFNAGIFGGNDIDFIKDYANKAFEFVNKNLPVLDNIQVSNFNIFFEQYLFYCLTKNKKVSFLFNDIFEDNGYKGFGNFEDTPNIKSYLHLLGTYKRDRKTCEKMSKQLLIEFPQEYIKVLKLFDIKSYKFYQNFFEFNSENEEITFKHIYTSTNKIDRYPRTIEILRNIEKLTFPDLEKLFNNPQHLEKIISELNKVNINDIYNYEKDIESYLNSLSTVSILKIIKESFENSKTYLSFVEQPFNYSFSINFIHYLKKSSYLIGDDATFFVGEDISKEFSRIIIPKLEKPYYQEIIIDELEEIIIQEIDIPINLKQLQKKVEKFFDEEDLNKSRYEYEKLIYSKIRMLIYNNIIVINKYLGLDKTNNKKSIMNSI